MQTIVQFFWFLNESGLFLLAHKAILVIGEESVNWTKFPQMTRQIPWGDLQSLRNGKDIAGLLSSVSYSNVPASQGSSGAPLLDTLVSFWTRPTTDPRDKMTGLLGLCRSDLHADYTQSLSSTYCGLVEHLISRNQHQDVLSVVQSQLSYWRDSTQPVCSQIPDGDLNNDIPQRRLPIGISDARLMPTVSLPGFPDPRGALNKIVPSWAPDWRLQIPHNAYLLFSHLSTCSSNASCVPTPRATFLSPVVEIGGTNSSWGESQIDLLKIIGRTSLPLGRADGANFSMLEMEQDVCPDRRHTWGNWIASMDNVGREDLPK